MEANGELERRIDSALAGYSGAEPLEGLEERVLRRVRVAEGARRRVFGWALALLAVASMVVVMIVVRTPRATVLKNDDIARVVRPAPVHPAPVAENPPIVPKRRAKSRAPRPGPLPKLEQFPAPAPITAEERALLSFVARRPEEAQQVFAELQKRKDEPIEIQPIQIPPLQIDGAQ